MHERAVDVIRKLIEVGAHVNAEDEAQKTPLFYASENNKSRVLPILL